MEEANTLSSTRYFKFSGTRTGLKEDGEGHDGKGIVHKFKMMVDTGAITYHKPATDAVNNPDTVTRMLKFGDTLVKEGLCPVTHIAGQHLGRDLGGWMGVL